VNDEIRDITIIGAGPVGMVTAFWAGMREASSRIVESLPELGGQLTTLYPEKWIFDVPGFPRIIAKDFVEEIRKQALEQFDIPVSLETTADRVEYEDIDGERILRLVTDKGDFLSRTLIIAGGHGAFEPKKLPGYDMTPWEGKGAYYLVGEKSEFAGKDVVIIGGGDSACDWAINLLDTAGSITLVHRREAFRAHEVTVKEVMDAAEAGKVDVKTPYQVKDVSGNGRVERITIFHSENEDEIQLRCGPAAAGLQDRARPVEEVAARGGEGLDQGRLADEDLDGGRLGGRRHHDLRRQAEADRHRLRGVGDRRRAGGAPHPA
jgi:thioredoxin reductase